ncbi:MAG: AAA family ATPase, partial [Pseudoclavibacter sp.]|nr:AAA family ATPase [Pseudoclavibacter sp.]
HALEMQIYEKRLQRSAVLERAASELHLDEEVLLAEYGPHRPVPDDDEALRSHAERAADAAAEAAALRRAAEEDEADEPVEAGGEDADAGVPGEGRGGGPGRAAGPEASEQALEGTGPEQAEASGAADAPTGAPYVRAEQERRLAAAERQLNRLGRINPLALEEFAALEQRHAYLSEQLEDLQRTRADLLRIVADIDERMKTVFAEAFEDTRAAFHEVFPVLFPGGTGDLTLTEPDDMLSTGIEVSVRPAGKKIERLTLLSGGERSLAAVALLIAIFKARPSPFYIMDEVEAALDDANLGRLLAVFEDLRASSQLIVITHQKRTMEIADALYGVSMRQDGVSAVVGQRIRREERD